MLNVKKIMVGSLCCLGVMTYTATYAASTTLLQVYHDAVATDPVFQQAKADYAANKQAIAEAAAGLLPQLSTTGNLVSNYTKDITEDYSINASQTLFSWSDFARIAQAHAVVRQAVFQLGAAEQSLIQRSALAYLGAVEAKSLYRVIKRESAAMKQQLNAIRSRYKLGHSTITDIDRVKGSYDLIGAQLISAHMNYVQAIDALARLTGIRYKSLQGFRTFFKLLKPKPFAISVWLSRATKDNLLLRAAEAGIVVARRGISVERGGYLPSISATASYYPKGAPNLPEANKKKLIYGIALSFNAFQGGATSAAVTRAQATYERAVATRDNAFREAQSIVQNSYIGVLEGGNQVKVERRAVGSNKDALRHTKAGYLAGSQTLLDVLSQQTNLFNAERSYVDGRIRYLQSVVNLSLGAGTLKPSTLVEIQSWMR